MPEFSVIIPVYNAERTLSRCMNSVLQQTLTSLEVILVDDGSTDQSLSICNMYVQKDPRVHVIHQKNSGPLAARIAGCRKATGKYISFVDSDDWIERNMCEMLHMRMQDVDMLATGVIRTSMDGSVMGYTKNLYPEGDYTLEDRDFLQDIFFFQQYIPGGGVAAIMDGPWSKVFRLDLVMKIIDKADVNIREFEDWLFTALYILQCKKIRIIGDYYYHYTTNLNSIGHTSNPDFLQQQNLLYNIIRREIIGNEYETLLLKQIQKKLMYNILTSIGIKLEFLDEVLLPIYHFPLNDLLNNKKIVLFGAGNIGRGYLIDWRKKGIDVVMWIDNMPTQPQLLGKSPVCPDKIRNVIFDYVVCAVRGKVAATAMKEQLIKLGVDEKKILWGDPVDTWGEYLSV